MCLHKCDYWQDQRWSRILSSVQADKLGGWKQCLESGLWIPATELSFQENVSWSPAAAFMLLSPCLGPFSLLPIIFSPLFSPVCEPDLGAIADQKNVSKGWLRRWAKFYKQNCSLKSLKVKLIKRIPGRLRRWLPSTLSGGGKLPGLHLARS